MASKLQSATLSRNEQLENIARYAFKAIGSKPRSLAVGALHEVSFLPARPALQQGEIASQLDGRCDTRRNLVDAICTRFELEILPHHCALRRAP